VRRAALACALAAALACATALAERADRDQPIRIEANRMSADDARRMNIFEGNVVLTQGTITVRADRIVVRQDAEGFQFSTATGKPVRFRQRQDPKGEQQEGEWLDGEALRIEIDDRNERIELFEKARVTRGGDEVTGDYIFVDQRSQFFQASAGKGQPGGRVRAVIQPRTQPEGAKPAAPAGKPAAGAR
jgi:lipopolysaccharide export system protein LptA